MKTTMFMKKIKLRLIIVFALGFLIGCPQEPSTPAFLDVVITQPQPQEQITCIQTTLTVAEPCTFNVTGTSTRVISEPDVGIYLLVQPVRPSAGGIFIQLPAAAVQSDGQWSATATLDDENIPVRNGATLNLQAVIAERNGGIETEVNPVPNPIDIPGILVQTDPIGLSLVVPTPTPLPGRSQ
jgi:hypothetical protein